MSRDFPVRRTPGGRGVLRLRRLELADAYELASIDAMLERIVAKLDQLILMVGFNLAMTAAIVAKLFAV